MAAGEENETSQETQSEQKPPSLPELPQVEGDEFGVDTSTLMIDPKTGKPFGQGSLTGPEVRSRHAEAGGLYSAVSTDQRNEGVIPSDEDLTAHQIHAVEDFPRKKDELPSIERRTEPPPTLPEEIPPEQPAQEIPKEMIIDVDPGETPPVATPVKQNPLGDIRLRNRTIVRSLTKK